MVSDWEPVERPHRVAKPLTLELPPERPRPKVPCIPVPVRRVYKVRYQPNPIHRAEVNKSGWGGGFLGEHYLVHCEDPGFRVEPEEEWSTRLVQRACMR